MKASLKASLSCGALPPATAGPPSPVVRSFRTFLHAAAADVADEMDAEDAAAGAGALQQQQQAPAAAAAALRPAAPLGSMPSQPVAAGVHQQQHVEPADDDFGDFSAAAAPLPVPQPPVAAAAPATQPVASTPSTASSAPAPPAAAAAPQLAAAIPHGVRRDAPLPLNLFGEEPEDAEPSLAEGGFDQPAAAAAPGGAAAAAAATALALQPTQAWQASAAAPAAPVGAPAAAGSGWDADDDFADFQGSEAQQQEWDHGQQQEQQPAAAAHQAAAAWDHPAQAAAQPGFPAQRLPSTFADRHGRVLAVDYPDRFVRQPPRAASAASAGNAPVEVAGSVNDQRGGEAADGWAGNGEGFADFVAAANGGADPAEEALPQHAATLAAPPAPPEGPPLPSTLADGSGPDLAADRADPFASQPPCSAGGSEQEAPAAAAGMVGALPAAAHVAPREGADDEDAEPADSCSAPPEHHVQQHGQAAGFAAFAAAADATARAEQQEAPRDAPQELPQPQQQEQSLPASPASGRRASAVLTALHPVSPRGGGGAGSVPLRPPGQLGGWQAAGLALGPAAGSAAAAAAGAEVVTEYAIAWSRLLQVGPAPQGRCFLVCCIRADSIEARCRPALPVACRAPCAPCPSPAGPLLTLLQTQCSFPSSLQAAAQQLRDSASLWAEAGRQGCWHELAALPAAQQHLAACAQLYAAAAVVRCCC